MLSRIAESLFWIGRYVERADNTARLLDVHLNVLLEDPWVDEPTTNASLLAVMHVSSDGTATRETVLKTLATDPKLSSSITGTLGAARDNARRAREVISTEVWESLNTTYMQLGPRSRTPRPHDFLTWVRERAAVVWGLHSATTSRDDAWNFMELGRSLERADMIARLLMTKSLAGTTGPNWTTLLRTCSAHEAYLRTVRSLVTEERAAEFLLIDRLFPRSIAYNLDKAETTLALIEPGLTRNSMTDHARLALGRARTNLEYQAIDDILSDLPAQMRQVQQACASASDIIRDRFFLPSSSVIWSQEAV
ncbi:alpha-E domain-containing protein [Demequina sp. TTPB684]|uniref:alpha-E domain-containing protein n=1 Tax=unclassified Demequina TaxID=2620311 RepID=UPI001CF57835|nr:MULTISPECIES: alpha-E domain-containing protein [unclassified Demequina]MCB2412438.1 alpha-E domain-containing protein [Demequina sp. TTPB684]UPU88946.1 alpha-E domain-containing protein [Demequina sp. TMPB413]